MPSTATKKRSRTPSHRSETAPLPKRIRSIVRRKALELARGASAVVIVGSHARGEATPDSDLDLMAVGEDSYLPRLERREGLLVSVSMQPFEAHLESFEQPDLLCGSVPG